jgi:mRNA interferase MazF
MDDAEEDIEAVCAGIGWIAPSRRNRIVTATPRVGQCYWVDYPHDAYPPEFVGPHPAVVVRAARRLDDTCIVVPLTSTPQITAPHIHQLGRNPNPREPSLTTWAVCDHLYTIHLARLRPFSNKWTKVYPRVDSADLTAIFQAIKNAMPLLP